MLKSAQNFNPDDAGVANGNYFGFPFSPEESALVLLSAPWDATVSYGEGTAAGPEAIIEASLQVEIYDPLNPDGWRRGIATAAHDEWIGSTSVEMREKASRIISHIEEGGDTSDAKIAGLLNRVNDACRELNDRLAAAAGQWLDRGKIVGLVGGDHSVPLGLIRELAVREGLFGVLHVDAHADLRAGYEGFEYSHASIMYNVLQIPQIERLVQVAVRDQSSAEAGLAAADGRIVQFGDYALHSRLYQGGTWDSLCGEMVERLPEKVYVSFDIDGLTREYAPGTGTPVPGGLSFGQAVYLLERIVRSGRRIIGFDLCEVSPSVGDCQWNANVGARMLYKLCNLTLLTNPNR